MCLRLCCVLSVCQHCVDVSARALIPVISIWMTVENNFFFNSTSSARFDTFDIPFQLCRDSLSFFHSFSNTTALDHNELISLNWQDSHDKLCNRILKRLYFASDKLPARVRRHTTATSYHIIFSSYLSQRNLTSNAHCLDPLLEYFDVSLFLFY